MENEAKNNDLLDDLYALRAGLSVVSQGADGIAQTLRHRIALNHDILSSCNWYFDEYNNGYGCDVGKWAYNQGKYSMGKGELNTLSEIKRKYGCSRDVYSYDEKTKAQKEVEGEDLFGEWIQTDEPKEYFKDCSQIVQEEMKEVKRAVAKKKAQVNFGMAVVVLGSILLLFGIIMFFLTIFGDSNYNISPVYDAIFITGFGGIGLIIIGSSFLKIDQLKSYKKDLSKVIRMYNGYRGNLANIDKCANLINQNNNRCYPIAYSIKQVYSSIYMELQRTFNKVLDERDWQYLDLIIYYFETGRADSKKEALVLLEREIQTNRIVGAIEEAKQCICSTIERAVSRISSQLNTISKKLSQVVNLQQVQIAQNAKIISQADLRNAMIEKSNVTSEKLMQDVNYIKTYGVKIK